MKRVFCLLMAATMAASLLSGCGKNEDNLGKSPEITYASNGAGQNIEYAKSGETDLMEKTTQADTLYVGAYGNNYTTSTLAPMGYNNLAAISLIYDTLFKKNFGTGEIECLLAESYEFQNIDTDPVLHIRLRDGLHFQSGDPITAADCFDSTVGRFKTVGMCRTYLGETVDVDHSWYEGDRDLYIKMYKYDRTILECLANQWFSISNASFDATATDDDYWDKVDGSGPFIVEEQTSGESVKMKVDDNYWGWGIVAERPKYDYMYVRFYSEASIMMIDYENGELDCCIGLGINDTERVLEKGIQHSNMKIISSGSFTVLCLPAYNEAFSDPKVREAIACAIDTDKAAKAAYEALGLSMNKYVSSMANFSREYKTDKYDPDKAKELLEKAGYKSGDLQLYTVVSSSNASEIALAEIVQGFLQDVGIMLKIDSYDYPTALAMQRNGTVSLCMTTFFTMNGDISGCFIQLPKGSYNKGAWLTQDYPELGEKLDEGRYAKTNEEAQEAYAWVQDWLDENNWYIPIVEYNSSFICRDYVDDSGFYNLMYARDIRNLDFK